MELDLQFREDVAVMTLNRPKALNALSFSLLADISAALDKVEQSEARALVVTGQGEKSFCAGADISELTERTLSAQKSQTIAGQTLFSRLDSLSIPSVALVNGYAFGGGLELALACTFRLATVNALFGLPEIKLGLIPGYGGTQRLPRLVGMSRALELVLCGKSVNAAEALAMGLVNRVVEMPALEQALAFTRGFTAFGQVAQRCAREAIQRGMEVTIGEGMRIEADLSTLAYQSADAAEGMQAFLQKRPPLFQDR